MPTNHTIEGYDRAGGPLVDILPGATFTPETYTIIDQDDDGELEAGDTLNGEVIIIVQDNLVLNMSPIGQGIFALVQTATRSVLIPDGGIDQFTNFDITLVSLESQTPGDTSATIADMCFAAGTQIACFGGEVAVEDLSIGDELRTADGHSTTVKWIGRQTVMGMFRPADRLHLIHISAGALGPNVPHQDLKVTADHAVLVEGVLIHAGALINGVSIRPLSPAETGLSYTVYHIETEEHEIILANGAPAENFIDNASRRAFDNFAEFDALYGDVPEMKELPYPRAMSTRQVPDSIRSRLAMRKVA